MPPHSLRPAPMLTSAVVLASFAASLHASSEACKPVFDAIDKQLATSTHATMTRSDGSKDNVSETSESISTDGAIYVQVQGKWKRSAMTPKDMQEQQRQNRRNTKSYSCDYVRDEPVNGEAAAVYSVQSTREDAKSDGRIWISKKRGLPLKQEAKMDMDPATGKSSMSISYDYDNVKAPADAK